MVRGKSQSMMGSRTLIFEMFLFVCLGVCFPLFGRGIGDDLLNLTWMVRRGGVGKRKIGRIPNTFLLLLTCFALY